MQKLDDPRPVDCVGADFDTDWPVESWVELPKVTTIGTVDFFELLEKRQSRRRFKPLRIDDLAMLLWHSQRCIGTDRANRDRSFGPLATAGGLATVRTIIISQSIGAWVYDRKNHRAGVIATQPESVSSVVKGAQEFFDIGAGSILLFAADRPLIEKYYLNAESLVLREAGILTGTIALISEALGLAFCPLGTQGSEWTSLILGISEEVIIPGGAAVIGGR